MLPEVERRRRVVQFLEGVQATRFEKHEQPKSCPGISEQALKVLMKASLEVGVFLLQIYQALGFHPVEGKRAIDELLALGVIRLHKLARSGRGGQPVVVEVVEQGVEELRGRGITPAEKLLKRGGFKHDCYARWLKRWANGQGFQVWFERTLGITNPKAFDVVHADGEGKLHGWEICLSGSAHLNASQAIKAAAITGMEDVTVLVEDLKLLGGIEKELKAQDPMELYRGRIKVRFLGEFFAPADSH